MTTQAEAAMHTHKKCYDCDENDDTYKKKVAVRLAEKKTQIENVLPVVR